MECTFPARSRCSPERHARSLGAHRAGAGVACMLHAAVIYRAAYTFCCGCGCGSLAGPGLDWLLHSAERISKIDGAVSANKALFAYRQVRPIDTVIVRAALETVMGLIILVSILIVLALFGRQIAPEYPMESILSFIGLILSGLGIGLIISVFSDLVPEFASLMNFIFKPLYLLSGAIFPLSVIPIKYREWAFLNPFAHGLELLRSSFFSTYHSAPEANFEYLYSFAIASIFWFSTAFEIFTAAEGSMIVVNDVHKRYQTPHGAGRWILKGVSFSIPSSVSVGLVGRNGAGKSTLLNLIGGVDTPTRGTVNRYCRVSWPMGYGGGCRGR